MSEAKFVHTCKLTFVVDSSTSKPTPEEILSTLTDLLYQAPEYLTSVDVVDTAKEGK